MPYSHERLAEMGASNLEFARRVAEASLDGFQRAAGLHLKAARTAVDAGANNLAAVLAAKDIPQAVALQSSLVGPVWQGATSFVHALADAMGLTRTEFARLLEERASAATSDLQQAAEQIVRGYPAGNEAAVAAVRNAFAAAESACDSMTQAVRQAMELARVGAATGTPARAAAAPVSRRKSAA